MFQVFVIIIWFAHFINKFTQNVVSFVTFEHFLMYGEVYCYNLSGEYYYVGQNVERNPHNFRQECVDVLFIIYFLLYTNAKYALWKRW